MLRKEDLFRHFRPDERMFVERVLDWVGQAEERYRPTLTPFLNPREQTISKMLVRRAPDLEITFDGGYSDAERKRAWILPPFIKEEDHRLTCLELEPADTSSKLKHPDVLGSLLGLGLKREVIGDILSPGPGCQIVVASEIAAFIRSQLNRVGRVSVHVKEIPKSHLRPPEQTTQSITASVASLRLDAVASEAFRLSRRKAATLIKSGKCRVNWKPTENPAEPVGEGDMISLRGHGRARVDETLGETRKNRLLIRLIRYL
ncbi:RNA-binding protein YlmH [Melghirimyces profundicolus]|uniref:RNA-binding protein YlmH n=1 Tax=Melghirimyces profundicolus TaxID=1242148 RepID=A0A2T6B7B4_9BACL|nr:YlmH/Sll1252 family protein [Melghirimyces profundicolus]PTX51946.1 RNA-binding protein YlmH [Melghirimyces profundicolus]